MPATYCNICDFSPRPRPENPGGTRFFRRKRIECNRGQELPTGKAFPAISAARRSRARDRCAAPLRMVADGHVSECFSRESSRADVSKSHWLACRSFNAGSPPCQPRVPTVPCAQETSQVQRFFPRGGIPRGVSTSNQGKAGLERWKSEFVAHGVGPRRLSSRERSHPDGNF